MPPLWKIKRELWRIFEPSVFWLGEVFAAIINARLYDVTLARKCRVILGHQPDKPRKAIYLIFPSFGLLPSHVRTLNYLVSKGLSVTVVSNLSLSQADEDEIKNHCHRYIERPNYGYDFGGYRDGVLHLKDELPMAEQLVLLNDSVWFPIHPEGDWLANVDDLKVDFAGAVSQGGFPKPRPPDYFVSNEEYVYDHKRKNFHYGSFALSIGPRILKDKRFIKFWKRYALTSDKSATIARGETGLTTWVIKNGFSHGDAIDVRSLPDCLAKMTDERLREVAAKLVMPNQPKLKQKVDELLAKDPKTSRERIMNIILAGAARQGASYALVAMFGQELDHAFLKKSPIWLDEPGSDATIAVLRALNTPAAREALQEAEILRKRLKPDNV